MLIVEKQIDKLLSLKEDCVIVVQKSNFIIKIKHNRNLLSEVLDMKLPCQCEM